MKLLQSKKQLRWLIYLIIPFFLLIVVLFLTPFFFAINSYPLVSANYNVMKINEQQQNGRSLTHINGIIIHNTIQKNYNILNQLSSFIELNFTFMNVNIDQIILNNANNFSQMVEDKVLPINSIELSSMWFANNVSSIDQLNPIQQFIYYQYSLIEPFIRAEIIIENKILAGITAFIFYLGEEMFFEYPTRFEERYLDLSTPTDFEPSSSEVLENYYETGNKSIFMVYVQKSTESSKQLLKICSLLFDGPEPLGVSSLLLNLQNFQQNLFDSLGFTSNKYTSDIYYLLRPVYSIQNQTFPKIIFQFSSQGSTSNPQNIFFNQLEQLGTQLWSPIKTENTSNLMIYRNGQITYYIKTIMVSKAGDQSNIIMYLLLKNSFIENQLISLSDVESNITDVIIPVSICAILAAIISFFILNRLLNSMNKNLFKINRICEFIVEGDLDVDIPKFKGAKDIREVYQHLRKINKINKYTTLDYFSGHFADKIVKYNEALQFFKMVEYEPAFLYENMGQTYLWVQECQKSIHYLKLSVDILIKKIELKYGTIQQIYHMKIKHRKMPFQYKEWEAILIRRLWKLCFTHFKYLDLKQIFNKNIDEGQSQEKRQQKRKQLSKEVLRYFAIFKKAAYPDLAKFSEVSLGLIFQTKQYITNKQFDKAKNCLKNLYKISDVYDEIYDEVTKQLKEKGSKNKFYHMKYKITYHSRISPQVIKSFRDFFKSKYLIASAKKKYEVYQQVFNLLTYAVRSSVTTMGIYFLIIADIRKLLKDIGISTELFETTHIFHQAMPLKSLHEGVINKDNQQNIYKLCIKNTPGLEREFMYLIDCSNRQTQQKSRKNITIKNSQKDDKKQYSLERSHYIFDKLIKPQDRVSVVRFNSTDGVRIDCSLLYKSTHQTILKKEICSAFQQYYFPKENQIIQAIERSISRIKRLKSEKIILIFFKSISVYQLIIQERNSKTKRKNERNSIHFNLNESPRKLFRQKQFIAKDSLKSFGDQLVLIMTEPELNNCKICLYISEKDSIQQFVQYFGLKEINKRIWEFTNGYNAKNNVVYIISEKYKGDIDRILMLKTQDNADNHVFMF